MKKYKIIIFNIIILIFLIVGIIFENDMYKVKTVTHEEQIKPGLLDNKINGICMMLEKNAGTGEYEKTILSSWPTDDYIFNPALSKCENGGRVSWNTITNKIIVSGNKSDKCYAYFDKKVPDILMTVNSIPTTYGKLGTISCDNSEASYNMKYNKVEISQINGLYTTCTLNYTENEVYENFASYISSLVNTQQGVGQVINEKGYRYEGKDPNNYVWFNNEYWRIIGVFGSESHGLENENLVKVIRNDRIGALVWNSSNNNDWTKATLNKLLNSKYLHAEDGTDTAYCYGHYTTSQTNCNYIKKGIHPQFIEMIENVNWYLGEITNATTVDTYYDAERYLVSSNDKPTVGTGYIGLMYPSDYGYASYVNDCSRKTEIGHYGNNECASKNWLYGNGEEWLISPYYSIGDTHAMYLDETGTIPSWGTGQGYGVRPALYFKKNVYKMDGDGSLNNPYIIGM